MSQVLNDLYARKGQIVTTQELLQSQLNAVNKGINEELNKGSAVPKESRDKKQEKKKNGRKNKRGK